MVAEPWSGFGGPDQGGQGGKGPSMWHEGSNERKLYAATTHAGVTSLLGGAVVGVILPLVRAPGENLFCLHGSGGSRALHRYPPRDIFEEYRFSLVAVRRHLRASLDRGALHPWF